MASNEEMAKLYTSQQSLTEWLEDIGHEESDALRVEDNEKRERLRELNNFMHVPFDEPTQFSARDLADNTPEHQKHLAKRGEEHCALRLIPTEDGLPKLRMRGMTIKGAYEWFKEQDIDPDKYRADYMPHTDKSNWATIFVVNEHGIYGEIIAGGHHQLTQGFFDADPPIVFSYNFEDWQLSREDDEALQHLKKIVAHLHVQDADKRAEVEKEFNVTFSNDYLNGYWETQDTDDYGLWFVDWNRVLGRMYGSAQTTVNDSTAEVSGMSGSPGKASGPVRIVHPDELADAEFEEGDVLVCEMTTPDYVPLMQKAAAIVTDQGGILTHAAIVARELKKPCVVGTGNATKELSSGQSVTVDADTGVVSID